MILFQSTCPARGTTPRRRRDNNKAFYFNPRAPRGARPKHLHRAQAQREFQSTCPARGTTQTGGGKCPVSFISIHVPREGHDWLDNINLGITQAISIHVPREGHDAATTDAEYKRHRFQSTCPARGTTLFAYSHHLIVNNFNPRAPRGARLGFILTALCGVYFNPRAPRGARQHSR